MPAIVHPHEGDVCRNLRDEGVIDIHLSEE